MPATECCVPPCENKGGHAFPFSDPDRLKGLAHDKIIKKSVILFRVLDMTI